MPDAQQNQTVTILYRAAAYQVNADGTAYLINPFDDAVRNLRYLRGEHGLWLTGHSFVPVEIGLCGALETAWEGMQ